MVNRLRRPAQPCLEPDLSSLANCGQNPGSSLAWLQNRLTGFSNADAKSVWTLDGETKALILKGIFQIELFCHLGRDVSSAFFCAGTKIFASRSGLNFAGPSTVFFADYCVDNLGATDLNRFQVQDVWSNQTGVVADASMQTGTNN